MVQHLNAAAWQRLSADEKIDDLRAEIIKLYGIVENLSHQDHVFVDAMHLVHSKLDGVSKSLQRLRKNEGEPQSVD